MNQLIILPIANQFGAVNPVMLSDDEDLVLIDTGLPHQLDLLQTAAQDRGIDLNRLTYIIVTHQDWDHMGNLADLKKIYPQAKIASSAIEEEYISGRRKHIRLEVADKKTNMSDEDRRILNKKMSLLKFVDVDLILNDNDLLPICGGIRIIETPGHMLGHISIYAESFKTLITGDAIVAHEGKLLGADPQYTLDMPLAKKSIAKMLSHDIERIICYHGGAIESDGKELLTEI